MKAAFRTEIVNRERGLCALCGKWGTQVHHEPPKGMGGDKSADTKERCVLLCNACHGKRTGGLWCPDGEQEEYKNRIKKYLEAVNNGQSSR